MACRAAALLLAAAAARGRRVDRFWGNKAHCAVEVDGGEVCWQGGMSDARTKAICGGTEAPGRCSTNGSSCDVSGASIERFTMFFGLDAFARPSEAGACPGEPADLKRAMIAGVLRNNRLCPSVTSIAAKWHEDMHEHILSNLTEAFAKCSWCVVCDHCVHTMSDVMVPLVINAFFLFIEWTSIIGWADFTVNLHSFAGYTGNLTDEGSGVPEGVREFAGRLHLSLSAPIDVAKRLLEWWGRLKRLLLRVLEPYLKSLVRPVISTSLRQLDENRREDTRSNMQLLQEALRSRVDGVFERIEALCA